MKKRHQLRDIAEIGQYLRGGNGKFTLLNVTTGVHKTFRMKQPNDVKERSLSFVSVLRGPDNTKDYAFCGTMQLERMSYKISKKSQFQADNVNQRTIQWLIMRVHQNMPLPANIEFYHEGTCSRCGRTLTTPESIKTGIGPVCASSSY